MKVSNSQQSQVDIKPTKGTKRKVKSKPVIDFSVDISDADLGIIKKAPRNNFTKSAIEKHKADAKANLTETAEFSIEEFQKKLEPNHLNNIDDNTFKAYTANSDDSGLLLDENHDEIPELPIDECEKFSNPSSPVPVSPDPDLNDSMQIKTPPRGDNITQFETPLKKPPKTPGLYRGTINDQKDINTKEIKTSMKNLIDSDALFPLEKNSNSKETKETKKARLFSRLIKKLPKTLVSTKKRDLTVPIMFNLLLHLANEEKLHILGLDNQDLEIFTEN